MRTPGKRSWERSRVDVLRYVNVPLIGLSAVIGLVLLGIVVARPLWRGNRVRALTVGGQLLLAVAVVGILVVTMPVGGPPGGEVNLVPGAGIQAQLSSANPSLGLVNVIGNVLLFVPAAALAGPVLGWTAARVVCVGASFSVAIEAVQLAVGRSADVDDVLLNTLGVLLGVLLASLAGRVVRLRSHSRSVSSERRSSSS